MNNKYQVYNNNAVLTANKADLTLMLYNGALKFCNQAVEAIERQEINEAHNLLVKAQDIVEELQITLDHKYPISKQIDQMYVYILEVLVEANSGKNIDKINEAMQFIREFRDLWKEVMRVQIKGV